ncbi:MAG: SDR family oxidoreductase [Thermoplasmatales archaeon]
MDYFKQAFDGKIGIISGAGSGQGTAVLKLLLENGAKVVAFNRSGNKPKISHENLKMIRADSTDISSLENVANIVEREYGKIDFLYNNHGIFSPSNDLIDGGKVSEFFKVNVVASINTTKVFLPLFKGKGAIVNVGASPSIFHYSSLEYSISKRAVEEMTRKLASMLRPRNIRVNALMPGSVDSSKEIDDIRPFSFRPLLGKDSVSTLEIAYVSLFLLSDLSYGINGQSIYVDAGSGL